MARPRVPGWAIRFNLRWHTSSWNSLTRRPQRDADAKAKATPGDATLAAAAKAAKDKAGQDYVQASGSLPAHGTLRQPTSRAQIEPQLEYYYKKYHGDLTGLDAVKTQAARYALPAGNPEYHSRQDAAGTDSRPACQHSRLEHAGAG